MLFGVGVCARGILWQQQSWARLGDEEPCQGSLPWNIRPQCLLEAIPSLLQRGKSLARLPMEQVEGMEPSVLPRHVAHVGWHLGTRSQV